MTPVARLLHLAELRVAAAGRKVVAAQAERGVRARGLETALAERRRLEQSVARQKETAREAFLGASHARVAVEEMLSELVDFDRLIADADARIQNARDQLDTAERAVRDAQKALQKSHARLSKRQYLYDDVVMTTRRRAELAEAELAEEQWLGQRLSGGMP